MNKTQRHAGIVDHLDKEPALRVNELAQRFDVSSETIRRDLNELKKRGLISRTYGGAVRVISREPALIDRQQFYVAERERIAAAALAEVEKDDVLMIGGGNAALALADALALLAAPLTVITSSFAVAMTLGASANINVQILPGRFNSRESIVEGPDTTQALMRFRAAKAFLGASGLTADGPSDSAIPAGLIYQAMSERSLHTYVLADSSKFEKPALSCYSPWTPELTLVTDKLPGKRLADAINDAGSKILVAAAD